MPDYDTTEEVWMDPEGDLCVVTNKSGIGFLNGEMFWFPVFVLQAIMTRNKWECLGPL